MATSRQTLHARIREQSVMRTRHAGNIPAVLYGHKVKSQALQVEGKAFHKVYEEAGLTSLVNLKLGNEERPVLIREVQRHPVRDSVIHVDFYQVRMDEKIRAQVPLNFIGEAPAVKDLGGVLVKSLDAVDLEALPNDLPHAIDVDVTDLDDFEKIIHISDLSIPKGVTLFHEGDDVVALVQPPRTEEELKELEGEVSEDVEAVEGIVEEEVPEGEEKKEGEAPEAPDQETKKE